MEDFTTTTGLWGIIGQPCSGKSALLSTLSRSVTLSRSDRSPGYVTQDDKLLLGELTVEEMLQCASELRMPVGTPESERRARERHLMHLLGLNDVQHAKVYYYIFIVA